MRRTGAALAALIARARWSDAFRRPDLGEVGPIGYAVMVAGIVLLAVAVVAWGSEVADFFMGKLDEVDFEE